MNLSADLLERRTRDGEGGVESWFLKANDPSGRRALWLKATIYARPPSAARGAEPVPPVAEAWAIAFDRERGHVATKTTVALEQARFARGALDVEVDGCELSLGRARGAIATGGRRLAWDLAVGPERAAPIVHFPARAMYEGRLPSSKAVTPLADALLDGVVTVTRGPGAAPERWDVARWPTMIGHNWGRSHAHLYAWGHCNQWDDASDLVFEGLSARVRVGPVLSPMISAAFVRYRGERFDLNGASSLRKNRGTISLRRWELSAQGKGVRLHADLAAETDDFVGLFYANPSGAMTYCLNSKLARMRLAMELPGGRSVVATSRAAALEIGTRDGSHGVRMYV